MKITQDVPEFKQIALTFESLEEVKVFWDLMSLAPVAQMSAAEATMSATIGNWLSNEAHL